ncbi:MAG: ribonuclease H-like domain-containing protein [Candidatus Brennerbacteria bacterium]|nr:ribonuclease H-like domain-containing protein [Candidatus Brennerbacteria bacterium]
MDKIVFDIETSNSPDDIGGWDHLEKLNVSVVGVYSYNQNRYFCFGENELEKLAAFFQNAALLVGFSSKRFDVPVLEKYFNFKLAAVPHFDILEEIERAFGRRVGLGILAEANLGLKKTGHGLEAIEMYKRGEIERLKSYCLQDVKITKEIFDLIRNQGYLWIPQRDVPDMVKLPLIYKEEISPQARLFGNI